MVHPPHVRRTALEWHSTGVPFTEIYRRLGLSRNTVAGWLYGRTARAAAPPVQRCPRCDRPVREPDRPDRYAYLLGQYLGDGHLLTTARVPLLTIACDLRHLGIIHEVATAMTECGARTAGFQERPGCISVRSSWKHWPCLFPQHGQGPKHLRRIVLHEWQETIVTAHPEPFLRGLFHSDGSRFVNRVRRNGQHYSYDRYMFVNESADIMGLCRDGLDRLGVAWRMARPNCLSVARRDAVVELDRHVGPKW